jgi:hypothetical protein
MKTYQWFTLSAALVITGLEAWLFTGASASAARIDSPTTVVVVAPASGQAQSNGGAAAL